MTSQISHVQDTERLPPPTSHIHDKRLFGTRTWWVNPYTSIVSPSGMAPNVVYLPNGQTINVSPVFAGLSFKSNDLNVHHSIFPPGWTIILESDPDHGDDDNSLQGERDQLYGSRKHPPLRYKSPTLQNDNLFISSISNPSNTDFKPATSPTRQIAMMLWTSLWWYFHQVHFLVAFGQSPH